MFIILAACLAQTNLAGLLRVSGVAPDFMIATLAALSPYYGWAGGLCTGALMSMLYDSAVGYALALDLILYTALGYFSPMMMAALRRHMARLPGEPYPALFLMTFFMTAIREVADIGYLFLIGAEQGMITLIRLLICSGLTAVLSLPVGWLVSRMMRAR